MDRDECPAWVRELDFLHDPAMHADPFPTLARLREECPVARLDADGGYWLASSYADVYRILRDNVTFSNRRITPGPAGQNAVRTDLGPNLLIQSDPPEHLMYRQIVIGTFTPQRAEELELVARQVCRRLLRAIVDRGEAECEFVRDFAIHVPGEVMLPLLGVPEEGRAELLEAAWSEEQRHHDVIVDPEQRLAVMKATRARQVAYFRGLFEQRRASGPIGDDLISTLVAARVDDGRELTMTEMLNLTMVLYNAGLHTTTNTLSNMMVYLSQHPDLRDRLVAHPELLPATVEELMRWESIVTGGRQVTRDVEVAGRQLHAGDVVLYSLGSAGRDEAEFGPDAAIVDIARGPTRHLQFGAGPHRCLGSHLARMEIRVALEEIHVAMPRYRLKPGTVPVRHTGQERGTEELWLEF